MSSTPEVASMVQPEVSAPVSTPAYNPPPPPHSVASPSASLYVGELDLTVTEAMLFEIFNMIGPVASIRVCRDAVTRRSLGYAYVNYLNTADGERALEQLNYSLIKNRPCRIMWSQRDPALRKTGQGNIFIKNLDEQIDNKALHDTFVAFGNVLSCKVVTDEQGRSKGYGFVHYETAEAAESAIKAVNGMLLNDKKVYVGHHISRKERQSKMEEMKSQFTNVYVKNIDPSVTLEELEELFTRYGDITSAVIQVDESGGSKGFGFVNYQSHEEAQRAVDLLHEFDLHGRKLFVSRAQKKAEREEELRKSYEQAKMERLNKYAGVNLYIKNLDDDIEDERLHAEFEPFGTITSCKVMRDEKATSKGFGFVCFSSPDEATKAITEMNNKMIGSKPLYVSLAQRRDVRRQQLESQLAQRSYLTRGQGSPAVQGFQGMPGMPGGPGVQGVPSAYLNGPMYYPPGPNGYARSPMGYGQPSMGIPRRLPPMSSYAPQYPMQNYRSRPAPVARGPGSSPTNPTAPIPRSNPPVRSAAPPTVRPPQPGATAAGVRPQPYKPIHNGAPSLPPVAPPSEPEVPPFNTDSLANVSPTEQKQMLGEVIYMRIANTQPELAGKITGMLLEMETSELLHLLGTPDGLDAKVTEALNVLHDFSKTQG